MSQKLSFLFLFFLICTYSIYSQIDVKGVVIDKDTKEPLIGVTVYSENDKTGTATDLDGSFKLKVSKTGAPLKVSYIGYLTQIVEAEANLGDIELITSSVGLNDVVVTSSIAIRRKTPVALSVIEPEILEAKMSVQEFPEILKSTPGVYATKQGGGYGDSRINLRGFSSENIAVMVNGIPMNDMEWGGVYWSNWAGLGDVTRSMQVQRGLGAAKVAAPSIGGSINIVTRSTDAQKGGTLTYALGNDGYNKIAFSVSTGLTKDKWAMTFLGSKTWGDGYIVGTDFEAYTWFLNVSKIINDNHQISLTGFGTPQWHNQRSSYDLLKILEWKKLGDDYTKFNPTYGYDKNGQAISSNRNRYHKPQISLNHMWTIDEKSSLSSSLYLSIGNGGARRWRGSNYKDLQGSKNGELNWKYRDKATNLLDYSLIQAENVAAVQSANVISESINNHTWVGLLSTYTRQLTNHIEFYGGLDLRYYKGEHTEKIKDLMGGEFFIDSYRKTSYTSAERKNDADWINRKLKVGDKIYRDNNGYVAQEGFFAQAEYKKDALSAFISASGSLSTYWRREFYYADNEKSKSKTFPGYNVKTGANYNIDQKQNVFFNMGYMQRAPFMQKGYFIVMNQSNEVNKDAKGEKSYSFEIGYGFRSKMLNANINLYHTKWMDKTMTSKESGSDAFINLQGIDARHQGIELELTFKPIRNLDITGMVSIGDWIWDSKASGKAFGENGEVLGSELFIDLKDVKVGNSAQSTFALGANYKCLDGLSIGVDYTYWARNYANYQIEDPTPGSSVKYYSPWRIPSAGILDLNANYKFKVVGLDAKLMGNINNVLNKEYISDAKDFNPRTPTGHTWEEVGVLYGFGRTYSVSMKVNF